MMGSERDNIWISEDFFEIDGDRLLGLGSNGDPYESIFTTVGEAYRGSIREHGRCTGKVYIDGPSGNAVHVGWTFVKRRPYEDDPSKSYLQQVWVTLHDGPPTRTIEYAYHSI